ncbi:MAG: quinoprotein relay system zinc metallohydrolase 1 [Hyphomicrobiaceae bacterium]
MFCAQAAPLAYSLLPQQLAEGVWMVPGAPETITAQNGGAIANIGIIATSEGAIVIDSGPSKRYGVQLRELAKTLTGKDVVRVYLTHFHPDHVFGCQAFSAQSIAATEGVIKGLTELGEGFASAMYASAGDWMRGTEVVLPKHVISTSVEDVGDRRMRLLRMKGHTGADLAIYDELTGIIFAGDLVFLDRAPTTPHADIGAWKVALASLGGIPHTLIVPGHGPAESNTRGLDQTRIWLTEIERLISKAFERGLDMTEAMALPLPEWTKGVALAEYEYQRTVMHIYPRLEALQLPKVGGRG